MRGMQRIVARIGWAVRPIAAAAALVTALGSAVEPAWLGVGTTDAVDGGVEIVWVAPRGPAAKAGIRPGDLLVGFAGRSVGGERELGRLLLERRPGEVVGLTVLRESEELRLEARLGARAGIEDLAPPEPAAPPAAPPAPTPPDAPYFSADALAGFGLELADMTPALRVHFGAPADAGVLVTRVVPGRLAVRSGLRVGDVIVSIADEPVASAVQVRSTLMPWRSRGSIRTKVVRARAALTIEIPAATSGAPAALPGTDSDAGRRALRLEIERLERRIEELQKELERIGGED